MTTRASPLRRFKLARCEPCRIRDNDIYLKNEEKRMKKNAFHNMRRLYPYDRSPRGLWYKKPPTKSYVRIIGSMLKFPMPH
jgi:hypothetical protein